MANENNIREILNGYFSDFEPELPRNGWGKFVKKNHLKRKIFNTLFKHSINLLLITLFIINYSNLHNLFNRSNEMYINHINSNTFVNKIIQERAKSKVNHAPQSKMFGYAFKGGITKSNNHISLISNNIYKYPLEVNKNLNSCNVDFLLSSKVAPISEPRQSDSVKKDSIITIPQITLIDSSKTVVPFKNQEISRKYNNYLGVIVGMDISNIRADEFTWSGLEPQDKTGIIIGLSFDHKLTKRLIFVTGLIFEQKGFLMTKNFPDSIFKFVTIKSNFNYISLPLKIGIRFENKVIFEFSAGVSSGFLLSASQSYDSGNYNLTKDIKPFDFSGLIEISGGIKIRKKFIISATANYQTGLNSISTESYFPGSKMKNTILSYSLQFKIPIGKKLSN